VTQGREATVVMNGTRFVALTTKAGVEDANDQEATLRAMRVAKAKKTARSTGKKKPRR
jgi:hypothetical protein